MQDSILLQNWNQILTTMCKWVVLVCFIGDVRDEVVCVIEWNPKPWKNEGQTGVVFETTEAGEQPQDVVFRGLKEELALEWESSIESMEEHWTMILHAKGFEGEHIIFEAKVFLVQLKAQTKINSVVDSGTSEILGRWVRQVQEILWMNGDARPGTSLALDMVFNGSSASQRKIFVLDGREVEEADFEASFHGS